MAKTSSREDQAEKLRRKLSKAQTDLEQAQELRAAARLQGEEEVEEARRRAAARLAKATERLERRAAKITRIEAQLQALEPVTVRGSGDHYSGGTSVEAITTSPEDVADELEEIEGEESIPDGLVLPEGSGGLVASEVTGQPDDEQPRQ